MTDRLRHGNRADVGHERQDERVTESPLNEAREWTGEWWLPDDPDTKVPGVLSFSPDEGLRLHLIGGWDYQITHPGENGSTIVTDELKQWQVVLGTGDGKAITLLGVSVITARSYGFGLFGPPAKLELRASIGLVGVYMDDPDEMAFVAASADIEDLTVWSRRSGIEETHHWGSDPDSVSGEIRLSRLSPLSVEAGPLTVKLSHYSWQPYSELSRARTLTRVQESQVIRFEREEPQPLDYWTDLLDGMADLTTCVQNLAAYSYSTVEVRDDLQARGIWAMVELVKLAIDANKPREAKIAADELSGLFRFDREGSSREHVRAGQLVLAGWLDYLSGTHDSREPSDPGIRTTLTPQGSWSEIIAARNLLARGKVPFSRWDWWEMEPAGSARVRTLRLPHHVDQAQLAALALSHGPMPAAEDPETASEYARLLAILTEPVREMTSQERHLKEQLETAIAKWEEAEDEGLSKEPLSEVRIDELRTAIQETLSEGQRVSDVLPVGQSAASEVSEPRLILGMNLRVPRYYLVEKIFNQTYADPKDLGHAIAQGFIEAEDQKIVNELRTAQSDARAASATAIRQAIEALGDEADHFVLITPFGGMGDLSDWYSLDFRESLHRVTRLETAALDGEAILFDPRTTLVIRRDPEEKEGLSPIDGTSIALGVFEDVDDKEKPQVRVEAGQYFSVTLREAPHVFTFGAEPPSTDTTT